MANQVFFGTFIHTPALDKVAYLLNTAVAVDATGTIAAVEAAPCSASSAVDSTAAGNCTDVTDVETGLAWVKETLLPRLGWSADTPIMACRAGQFFFPGFIGGCSSLAVPVVLSVLGLTTRHPSPRLSIPQCRHLWQVDAARLA